MFILLFKKMENDINKEENIKDNNEKEKEIKEKDNISKENNESQNEEKKEYKNDNDNIIKEDQKENEKEKEIKKDGDNKNDIKDKEEEKIDPHLIFQKELLDIINKQEKILSATSTINEKFDVSNQITKEQIASFKINIDKYGKYLLMIKKELGMISDTMRKIKKLAKEQKK